MRLSFAASFSAITVLSGTFAPAQELSVPRTGVSTEIRELIDLIEKETGNNIRYFLAEVSTSETPYLDVEVTTWPTVAPGTLVPNEVDFGYAVFDENGEPIDLFGPEAPVIFTGDKEQMVNIKGYPTPENLTIQVVGRAEYAKVQEQLIEEMRAVNQISPAGVTIGQVGQKAQQATTALLIEICPQPYYAEGLTLYMNAGLDFVVFNTGTGTELNFVFSNQCSSFLSYLKLEAKQRGLIPQ